tara:strand:+ start:7521 stop:8597 length:1077 start_codon:yes stop_codon:yes gene_type:complete
MKKIRVALCISGEMRRWPNCHNSVMNLSTPYSIKFLNRHNNAPPNEPPPEEIDYELHTFIHTWDQITYSKKQTTWELNLRKDKLDHKEMIDKIKPKAIQIESKDALDVYIELFKKNKDFRECEDIEKKIKLTNYTCLSQFYSMRKCHDLRRKYQEEHNVEYDIVIRTRSDILIKEFKKQSVFHVLHKLAVFDDNKKKHVCTGKTPLLYCPWIYGDHRLHTIMEYALMLGRPATFDKIFKGFPEKLPKTAGFGNTSHGVLYDHIHNDHTYIRAPIPLHYSLDHHPVEMVEDPCNQDIITGLPNEEGGKAPKLAVVAEGDETDIAIGEENAIKDKNDISEKDIPTPKKGVAVKGMTDGGS